MRTLFRVPAFIFLFLLPVFGKLAAQSITSSKPLQIAVINSLVFEDEREGVTKLLTIKNKVNAEFKARADEFTAQQKKYDDLVKTLQSSSAKNDPTKVEQATQLQRDLKYKQETLQNQFQKRYTELVNPVYTAMAEAMGQWCKKKGYNVAFDISKDDKGIIVWMEEQKIDELTKDLIKYFNTVL